MSETLDITTEQINDRPLLLGIIEDVGIRRMIDARIQPHGGWQGISVGTVVSIWLCHLLMERDHRLVSVRDWAAARTQTVNALLGITLRDTDLTDDRLANALTMLSDAADQAAVDHALLTDWLQVYALPTHTVRLDSTSVSVYHDDSPPEGLLRWGHSKDHRPDLAQFKAMLASLDPLGLPVARQVVPGNQVDDGLYVPAYDAAVRTCSWAATARWGHGPRGRTARPRRVPTCAPTARREPPRRTRSQAGSRTPWPTPRAGRTCARSMSGPARSRRWPWSMPGRGSSRTGRRRGSSACWWCARPRCRRGCAARGRRRCCARRSSSRPPGRGRTVSRTRAALAQAVTAILTAARLAGVVRVDLAAEMRPDGSSRWTVRALAVDRAAWQQMVDRLGWHVYVTNTTADQYTVPALVDAYRHQVIQERGFARLKTRNLRIRPVYLSDERRIAGLTWLLCLALRVLTLTAYRLRTALQQRGETLAGLTPPPARRRPHAPPPNASSPSSSTSRAPPSHCPTPCALMSPRSPLSRSM